MFYPEFTPVRSILFLAAVIWSVIWQGFALWRAARNEHRGWFIVLLIIHTVGILDIIYLLAFSKKKDSTSAPVV